MSDSANKKQKRSVALLLGAIVATICMYFLVSYMGDTVNNMDRMSSAQQAGTGLAMMMVTPSVVVSGIGTIFAWLGWLMRMRGFALTAGILFAVAIGLMIPWFMYNIVQMILCFIGYARMKKQS